MDHKRIFPRPGQSSHQHTHYHPNTIAHSDLHPQPECHAHANQNPHANGDTFAKRHSAPQYYPLVFVYIVWTNRCKQLDGRKNVQAAMLGFFRVVIL